MQSEFEFLAKYQMLERRMAAQALADGDVFLPNPAPDGPVDYVLICMEPSLGLWAAPQSDAEAKVEAGFRNFLYSLEDFILHYCARSYLCAPNERYHVTDLSKGAMLVEHAGSARIERYDRWYDLLVEELALVSQPSVEIIAVGKAVSRQLSRRKFNRLLTSVMHYSGQAAAARKAGIIGRERDFEEFSATITLDGILSTAEKVLVRAGISLDTRHETLSRLRKAQLSESRRQLMFIYKTAFERIGQQRQEKAV